MSFEGFYQSLCELGHYNIHDLYWDSGPHDEWKCSYCKAPIIWWNLVNTTNGSYCDCPRGQYELFGSEGDPDCEGCEYCDKGRIDGKVALEILVPEKIETCNLGHNHIVEETRYKIPEEKGHKRKEKSKNQIKIGDMVRVKSSSPSSISGKSGKVIKVMPCEEDELGITIRLYLSPSKHEDWVMRPNELDKIK